MTRLPITQVLAGAEEAAAVAEVIASGWLVQGPRVQQFEEAVAQFTGARYAVALNSCTSGQFIMSRIAGFGAGDEALVPSLTWISTANAIEFVGAKPVLCDIDLNTFNIDMRDAASRATERTRAVVPVHLFGLPADMSAVAAFASPRSGIQVIEDCACALGGRVDGRHCGLEGLGGILSFHPRKSITTGEGGMILTNDVEVSRMARSLRDHGAVKSDMDRHTGRNSFLLSEYPYLGYNMRLTDLQAAVGVVQMRRLPDILARKEALAAELSARLAAIPWLRPPVTPAGMTHGYQAFCTLFKPEETLRAVAQRDEAAIERLHQQRNDVMRTLEDRGIATRQGTHAVHLQKYYRDKYGFRPMDFPAAYAADRLTIALPFYPQMTAADVDFMLGELRAITIS